MENIKNQKGISLIVLVITILVMIILAGVVVVTMSENNPIEKAKQAKDKTNIAALKEEIDLYIANVVATGVEKQDVAVSKEEANKNFSAVTGNLKNNVEIKKGKTFVSYKVLSEVAKEYARENYIYDADDKIAPDADIYVETVGGKKYVTVDSVDYQTDIDNITCSNGETKNITPSYGKVGYRIYRGSLSYDDMFIKNLKNILGEPEVLPTVLERAQSDVLDKYDILILNGGFYYSYLLPNEGAASEQMVIDFLNKSTKEKPKMVVTLGNDSEVLTSNHPLFKASKKSGARVFCNLTKNPSVDNIITRQIDKWANKSPNNKEDFLTYLELKKGPNITEYYTDANAAAPLNGNIAMYQNKENGSAWLHFSNSPHFIAHYMQDGYIESIVAGINKGTSSRSMSVDVTNKPAGTKISFTVTDIAGNQIVKEITL